MRTKASGGSDWEPDCHVAALLAMTMYDAESLYIVRGVTDCHVAALLAMTMYDAVSLYDVRGNRIATSLRSSQ